MRITKKRRNVIIILLLGVFVGSFIGIFYAPFVVSRTWLTVEQGEFQDTKDDGDKPMVVTIGGYDLISFTQTDDVFDGVDTIVYYGEAVFGWELLCYTNLLLGEPGGVFVGWERDHITQAKFLHFSGYDWFLTEKCINNDYYAHYRECAWSSINEYHYDGNLPLTMSINDDLSGLHGVEIGDSGITIQGAQFEYQFTETRRVNYDRGVVGDYNDEFTSIGPESISVTSVNIDDAEDPDVAYINELDIGVARGSDRGWFTIQSETSDSPEYTGHYSTAGPQTFNIPISIRPRIEEHLEVVNVAYGKITVKKDLLWDLNHYWHLMEDPYTKMISDTPVERRIAAKITNQYINQEFETTVTLVATVKFDHELSQTELDDPQFYQGDQVWNMGLGGSNDITLVTRNTVWDNFIEALFGGLNWIITVVITLSIIYIIIRLLPVIRVVGTRKK